MAEPTRPEHNARGRATREEILRAALQVIGERGISATTHRGVALAAGVPLGAPSYYFGGIDGLLHEALLLFTQEEVARLHRVARSIEQLDAVTDEEVAVLFSRAVAETHVGQATTVLAQFQLYLEAPRRPAMRAAAAECLAAYRDLATTALRATGRRRAEEAAGRFVALCDGLGLHQLADPQPDYAAAILEPALLDLLRAVD